jgi:hypothetical protein
VPKTLEQIEEALIDDDDAQLEAGLTGYAAAKAAAYLVEHWVTCGNEIHQKDRLSDIDLTIAQLKRFREHAEKVFTRIKESE